MRPADRVRVDGVRSARAEPSIRRGVTLLELLVVLVLLALVAALVAPALRLPVDGSSARSAAGDEADALARVADAARDLAVRRGQALHLDVAADGRWTVVPAVVSAVDDTAPLRAGRLDTPRTAALRVVISPLGTCVPDGPGGVDAPTWDTAACRPALALSR